MSSLCGSFPNHAMTIDLYWCISTLHIFFGLFSNISLTLKGPINCFALFCVQKEEWYFWNLNHNIGNFLLIPSLFFSMWFHLLCKDFDFTKHSFFIYSTLFYRMSLIYLISFFPHHKPLKHSTTPLYYQIYQKPFKLITMGYILKHLN